MEQDKNTESEEILEFHFASDENAESDFSYNEAIMGESMVDFLKEISTEAR